jgi:hypothetical protein
VVTEVDGMQVEVEAVAGKQRSRTLSSLDIDHIFIPKSLAFLTRG